MRLINYDEENLDLSERSSPWEIQKLDDSTLLELELLWLHLQPLTLLAIPIVTKVFLDLLKARSAHSFSSGYPPRLAAVHRLRRSGFSLLVGEVDLLGQVKFDLLASGLPLKLHLLLLP